MTLGTLLRCFISLLLEAQLSFSHTFVLIYINCTVAIAFPYLDASFVESHRHGEHPLD